MDVDALVLLGAYVSGVAATPHTTLMTRIVTTLVASSRPLPAKAMVEKITESRPRPTVVDEMVRSRRNRPCVAVGENVGVSAEAVLARRHAA